MTLLEKALASVLVALILVIGCAGAAITEMHASVTINFGRQEPNPLNYVLPDTALRPYPTIQTQIMPQHKPVITARAGR